MLQRKITENLLAWKNRPDHKPLLVQGARQVGKTFIIEKFGKENYASMLSINFEQQPSLREVFDGDHDIKRIISALRLAIPECNIIPGKTLLFFDEIQSCPAARTALKFFALDGSFDVIASGSLLGINYAEVSSFPVGYTERLSMHGLDFEEFLWALGVTPEALASLQDDLAARRSINKAVHEKFMGYLRDYIVVGGMPAVVQSFINSRDYQRVLELQRGIVADYRDDIAKYALGNEKTKACACFDSIPQQLARDSKKFMYSLVQKGGTARKFGGSLEWLKDAGIISFCHCLERLELPLAGQAIPEKFKVYLTDLGLLVSMLEDGTNRDILNGNLGIYKGAIFENLVADFLIKLGRPLFYFERNSRLEMDFIVRFAGQVTAIEVKSAQNRKAKSMDSLVANHGLKRGFKLSPGNIGLVSQEPALLEAIPLYLAPFLLREQENLTTQNT